MMSAKGKKANCASANVSTRSDPTLATAQEEPMVTPSYPADASILSKKQVINKATLATLVDLICFCLAIS